MRSPYIEFVLLSVLFGCAFPLFYLGIQQSSPIALFFSGTAFCFSVTWSVFLITHET